VGKLGEEHVFEVDVIGGFGFLKRPMSGGCTNFAITYFEFLQVILNTLRDIVR
jgi:hypothetical protein